MHMSIYVSIRMSIHRSITHAYARASAHVYARMCVHMSICMLIHMSKQILHAHVYIHMAAHMSEHKSIHMPIGHTAQKFWYRTCILLESLRECTRKRQAHDLCLVLESSTMPCHATLRLARPAVPRRNAPHSAIPCFAAPCRNLNLDPWLAQKKGMHLPAGLVAVRTCDGRLHTHRSEHLWRTSHAGATQWAD